MIAKEGQSQAPQIGARIAGPQLRERQRLTALQNLQVRRSRTDELDAQSASMRTTRQPIHNHNRNSSAALTGRARNQKLLPVSRDRKPRTKVGHNIRQEQRTSTSR